jgi:drug/metabolite transporter (DMT)-like permease
MNWFFIALIGPILYAFANHTDKYLISKYLKGGEVGSLIIFSAIFSIVALPIIIFIHPVVFGVSLIQAIVLGINGMLVVVAILFYFYALHKDEASYVVPFYQTIPIFAFILGYFILGETITKVQGIASLVIIAGALILSFELGLGKIRFKKDVVLLMLGASLLFAVNGVIFKLIAVDEGFWPSTFWGLVGKIILGFGFLFFVPSYRRQFLAMLKENKVAVLGLNSMSESLFIVAEAAMGYAIILAPVALVLLVNAFQPFFVLIIGVGLTLFFPRLSSESISKNALIQKICGIGLIIIGTYFLGV